MWITVTVVSVEHEASSDWAAQFVPSTTTVLPRSVVPTAQPEVSRTIEKWSARDPPAGTVSPLQSTELASLVQPLSQAPKVPWASRAEIGSLTATSVASVPPEFDSVIV